MGLKDNTHPSKGFVSALQEHLAANQEAVVTEEKVSVTIPTFHKSKGMADEDVADVYTNKLIEVTQQYASMGGPILAKTIEDLKRKLQSIANEQIPPGETATFFTDQGEVTFSARKSSRSVCNKALLLQRLIGKLGIESTAELISIPLATLDKVLSPQELAGCIEEDFGPRVLLDVKSAN